MIFTTIKYHAAACINFILKLLQIDHVHIDYIFSRIFLWMSYDNNLL